MNREDQLVARIRSGDDGAIDELVAALYPEILRYCIWHAPNRALGEDAAQETFLKLIRCLGRYECRGKFRAFLYRIAANSCADLRRQRWMTDAPYEALGREPQYAEAGFGQVEDEMALIQRIRCLPEDLREIVILRFGQELTLREIAQVVDAPLRTVQSRLRAALKRIRREMKGADSDEGTDF